MQLPLALTAAIAAELEGRARKDLALSADKQSVGYRQGAGSQAIGNEVEACAYAAVRMPATFAACAAVFELH